MKKFLLKELRDLKSPKISIFYFWLIGLMSFIGAIGIVGVIWIFSRGSDNPGGPYFQVLVDFPGIWIISVVHIIFASLYFAVSRSLYSHKKFALMSALAFLVVVPPLYSFAITYVPQLVEGWPFGSEKSLSYFGYLTNWVNRGILTNLFVAVPLINLLLAWKEFNGKASKLGKVAKLGYIIPPVLTILLCLGGLSYMYYIAYNVGDFKVSQVQKEVGFKVFTPEYLPTGFRLNNYFINKNNPIEGIVPVQTLIDRRIKDVMAGKTGFVTVRQLRSNGLSPQILASKRTSPEFTLSKIQVRDNDAYLVQKTISGSVISELYFYLDQETIGIFGSGIEPEELIKIANSMK